jgi:hypothetical protein
MMHYRTSRIATSYFVIPAYVLITIDTGKFLFLTAKVAKQSIYKV